MLTGRLLAESLRIGADLAVADLPVVRIGRHDVSNSTTPSDGSDPAGDSLRGAIAGQPRIWTFLDFEAPDDRADDLAHALAAALQTETGWWADFVVEAIMWWSSLDGSSVTASATPTLGPWRSLGDGPQELGGISLTGVTESSGR